MTITESIYSTYSPLKDLNLPAVHSQHHGFFVQINI